MNLGIAEGMCSIRFETREVLPARENMHLYLLTYLTSVVAVSIMAAELLCVHVLAIQVAISSDKLSQLRGKQHTGPSHLLPSSADPFMHNSHFL